MTLRSAIIRAVRQRKATLNDNHSLVMTGLGAHYSYVFDLGPRLNINRLADRLLSSNMAIIAASPATDELRVSRKIIKAERDLRYAQNFHEFMEEFQSDEPNVWILFKSQPWLTFKLLIRYLIIVVQRQSQSDGIESAKSNNSEDAYSPILTNVENSVSQLNDGLLTYHLHGALRVRMEQNTHFPRYFKGEPYIRLALNRVFFKDPLMEGEDAIEASLMIHRSGICMLTLSTGVSDQLQPKDIATCMQSNERRLEWAKISLPAMTNYLRKVEKVKFNARTIKKLNLEKAENQRWVKVSSDADAEKKGEDPLTVKTVFAAYLGAIETLAKRTITHEWHCYTTMSLGRPLCCDDRSAKAVHADTFASLMLRARYDVSLEESAKESLIENHLKIADRELWLSAGNAMHIDWNARRADFIEDIKILIPIESALLQSKQLEQIDSITTDAVVRDRKLFEAQSILAIGLQEYRRNLLTGPDDGAIVNAILEKQDSHNLYSRLHDRVKTLESVVSSRYSRMQNRRSIAISVAGFLVVLFALLPRISETLDVFSKQGDWPAAFITWVDCAFGGRPAASLTIYFTIVIGSLAIIVLLSFRWRRINRRRGKFGKSSPRNYEITIEERSPRD